MTKSLIVYFSQGGTTAQVAESISAGLRGAEHQVRLCNLKDERPPSLAGYDLLGTGFPVYIFRPPFNVLDYLEALPDLAGLSAFVFELYSIDRGDAGNLARRILRAKGAQEIGYFYTRGAEYFLGYLRQGYLFSADHPTAEELDMAEAFGREVSARFAGQEYPRPDEDEPPSGIYRLERFLTRRWLVKHVYSRLFRVKVQACIACGLCMKRCPTRNIAENSQGRPVWSRNCLLCLYCEMVCPVEAIVSPLSWPIAHPFIAYNIRRASRDPSVDYARVTFSQGRVRRVE